MKNDSLEFAWVIEKGDNGHSPRYRTLEQGLPTWTYNIDRAVLFFRREDAEKFAENDEDAWVITQLKRPLKKAKDPKVKCSNCNKTYRQTYSNKGFDCTGIVNETFRNCDVIRSCRRYDTGKTQLEDLSPEEALSIATGLLAAVHSWMKFTHKRPCAGCPDKECSHNDGQSSAS